MRCQRVLQPGELGQQPVEQADRDGGEDEEEDDLLARERGARGFRLLLNVALQGVHVDVGHPASGLMLDGEAARSRAASNTSSSIAGVSLPVNVFCWLGWKQPSSGSGRPRRSSAPWPKRGRGRGAGRPPQRAQAQRGVPGERAEADDHARASRRSVELARRSTAGRRRARPGVGLLAGGAQRTAAVIHASRSASPSPACDARSGWLAKPGAVQRGEQEVARAVAGEDAARCGWRRARRARGRGCSTRASGSPKPGIGRPQ